MTGLLPRLHHLLAMPTVRLWDYLRCRSGLHGWHCQGRGYHRGRK